MPTRAAIRRDLEQTALPHMDSLYGAALRLTRNPRDAEDLVQDTMLRAYRFWKSFKDRSNCRAWLFKILTNTFINEYQRGKRRREVLHSANKEQQTTGRVIVDERAAGQLGPDELIEQTSVSDTITKALTNLPSEFRVAVLLSDLEEFSYKEIAEIMNCPVGTVMSRLYRGRKLLQEQLRSYAIDNGIIRGQKNTPKDSSKTIALDDYRKPKSRTAENK